MHEDVTPLFGAGPEPNKKFAQDVSGLKEDPAKRKKWFAAETNRKAVKIDRSVVVSACSFAPFATVLTNVRTDRFRLLQRIHRLQDSRSQAPDRPVIPSRQVLGWAARDVRAERSVWVKDVPVGTLFIVRTPADSPIPALSLSRSFPTRTARREERRRKKRSRSRSRRKSSTPTPSE